MSQKKTINIPVSKLNTFTDCKLAYTKSNSLGKKKSIANRARKILSRSLFNKKKADWVTNRQIEISLIEIELDFKKYKTEYNDSGTLEEKDQILRKLNRLEWIGNLERTWILKQRHHLDFASLLDGSLLESLDDLKISYSKTEDLEEKSILLLLATERYIISGKYFKDAEWIWEQERKLSYQKKLIGKKGD